VEQLNIEGKRSGEGFVAHKAMLVSALSRALADRVVLMDITLGREGLLGYLKALGGSNVVKVIPSNGSASGVRTTDKRLKVICGANTSYLADSEWIGEKTPLTLCDIGVSPSNSVKPNVGTIELAEALTRVLPFTAKGDDRPVLACVNFIAKDGKLTIVSADGFRLAIVTLDYDDGEGQALINRDNLAGVVNALKRAKRARVSFEPSGESLDGMSLIIDTELIRYKWVSVIGDYPDWQKLIPTEFHIFAHFDTVEAIKAVNSLKVLANADTDGEGKVRVDGQYLAEALRACGGMVEFKLTSPLSPMLFSANGYHLVVLMMITSEAQKAEAERAKAEAKHTDESTEPKAKGKRKGKGKGKTQPEPVTA